MADQTQQQMDEIDRLLAADPNAHVVEGNGEVWLLTGEAMKVAREATGRSFEPAPPPPPDSKTPEPPKSQ